MLTCDLLQASADRMFIWNPSSSMLALFRSSPEAAHSSLSIEINQVK